MVTLEQCTMGHGQLMSREVYPDKGTKVTETYCPVCFRQPTLAPPPDSHKQHDIMRVPSPEEEPKPREQKKLEITIYLHLLFATLSPTEGIAPRHIPVSLSKAIAKGRKYGRVKWRIDRVDTTGLGEIGSRAIRRGATRAILLALLTKLADEGMNPEMEVYGFYKHFQDCDWTQTLDKFMAERGNGGRE